ncbi:MAG: hypothetical protein AAF738_10465, partial [Bacteroidota bacterium]
NFNLQLAGELGDEVQILAAITDENIPLQAEGNTQNLQEFDRLYIQLKRRQTELTAGDYELTRPQSYFMNYYKKLQGATLQHTTEFASSKWMNKASVAVARGKFARNMPLALEGNQGPYKLRGNEGERFIIALAGTEKVFLDGELLERGIERDYIIDYNRAELTFTNQRLITKDRRIIVEFEYATQNYLTSLYAVNSHYQHQKWDIYFNLYHQQDSKSAIGDSLQLSDEQRSALIQAGDEATRAVVSSIDTLEAFSSLRVLYEYRDTTFEVNGNITRTQILEYSTAETARLSARFSLVGQGNGDYVQSSTQVAANGRVYEWIAPDSITGLPRGNYAPVIQLAAPQLQQLYTFGTTYDLNTNGSITTEFALSNNDQNRFSALDEADDLGGAVYAQWKQNFGLGRQDKWKLETQATYEWVQANFRALNPYRTAEFTRDWNVTSTDKKEEQLWQARAKFRHKNKGYWSYEYSQFMRDSIYAGAKQSTDFSFQDKGWKATGRASFLRTNTSLETTRFWRPKVMMEKRFSKLANWTLGAFWEQERNERSLSNTDS